MIDEILKLSAHELSAKFAKKEVSPVEVYQMTLKAINNENSSLNAFTVIDDGANLNQAKASEARWAKGEATGLLDGVPITMKDCFDYAGWPSHFGSKINEGKALPTKHSIITELLLSRNSIIAGKTTMPDLFWKITNESPVTGVTSNPWDVTKSPGGSSGGAAAATAAGLGYMGMSSDAAGSIRIPASFCGLVGLKPSNGVIPYYPQGKAGDFATNGPVTRSVEDLAIFMGALQHKTPLDPWTMRTPGQDFLTDLNAGVKGFKMAYTNQLCTPYDVNYEVIKLVEHSLGAFKDSGADVDESVGFLSNDKVSSLVETFKVLRLCSLYSIVQDVPQEKRAILDQDLYRCSELGRDYSMNEYFNAEHERRLVTGALARFFEHYDVLLMPTIHRTAFDVSTPAYPLNEISLPPLTVTLFNMSGFPAVTVPCGLTKDGMPVGLQIVGAPNQDAKLLRVARAFEKAFSFPYFKFLETC